MENQNNDQKEAVNQIYEYAANLLVNQKKTVSETINALIEQGLDKESASTVVLTLNSKLRRQKRQAEEDMLYGALWCIGGTVATLADIGFIFWGAIVFGAILFIKGAVNS